MSSNELEIELSWTIARQFILALVRHVDSGPGRSVSDVEVKSDRVVLRGPDPIQGLRQAIELVADYVTNQVKAGYNVRLPLSSNDRNLLQKIFNCYKAPLDASPENVIRKVGSVIYSVNCDKSKLPSILKPEIYEYTRTSGYLGKRKIEEEYQAESVILALIGYIGARVGSTEGEAVLLLPPDDGAYPHRYFFNKYSLPVRNIWNEQIKRKMRFPGLKPETALILWLALELPGTEKINLVSIKEPVGREPAILSTFASLNLETVRRDARLWKCLVDAEELVKDVLERALTPSPQRRSDLAVRASTWLYESLVGIRRLEEVVYMMSRDYVSAILGRSEIERGDIRRDLARLADKLYKCYYL